MQQSEIMRTFVQTLHQEKSARYIVEPDVFEGDSQSVHYWLWFFEYACDKNMWHSDDTKILNMRRYLRAIARKWYDVHLMDHEPTC